MGDKREVLLGSQEAARRLHLSPSGLRKYAYDLERALEEFKAQVPGGSFDHDALPIKGASGRRLYSTASIELLEKIKDHVRQGHNRLDAARRVLGIQVPADPDLAESLRDLVQEEVKAALKGVRLELADLRRRIEGARSDSS